MTFGLGLGSGLKALTAARLGVQTAGQNVSNANTPGYSRQRVVQAASFPFSVGRGLQIGSGVDVSDISRIVDVGLERRITIQTSFFGSAELEASRLRELESVFAEPDGGLSAAFSELFGTISQLQTDPSDRALRGGAIQSGTALTDTFNLLSQRFGELSGNTFQEVLGHVRSVNERTTQIAAINADIVALEANGSSANDLRDTRQQLVTEIAQLTDIRVIERPAGSIDVSIAGRLVVSGSRSTDLIAARVGEGETAVFAGDLSSRINIESGVVGALLAQEGTRIPGLLSDLDNLAFNLALEFNRIHTTGVPGSGPFRSLTSAFGAQDGDDDGNRADELLAQAGYDFEIVSGAVYVSVTDDSTGEIERTRIDIDASRTTLRDFADSINAVSRLSAQVDPSGRLRITAESGYGFDFGTRLDASPNSFGSFGGTSATLGSSQSAPFDLSGATFPLQFNVDVDGTIETVTINATDFSDRRAVSAADLAAAINDDLSVATARDIGGRLLLRSDSVGAGSTLTLTDGANGPLAALGIPSGPASGRDSAVSVA